MGAEDEIGGSAKDESFKLIILESRDEEASEDGGIGERSG